MGKRALIVWGGWDGHEPEAVAGLFREILEAEQFEVTVSDTLDAFADRDLVFAQDLLLPIWTMGTITDAQKSPVFEAVNQHGIGLAGCHGGMCDAFRTDTEWQFMTGAQWVSHPGNDGVKYWVHLDRTKSHPIIDGLPDFEVASEQYYLHFDPGVNVLGYTHFPTPGVEGPHTQNPCRMPQIFTKMYGKGKVFYNALGHQRNVLEPEVPREIMRRGFLWAAR
ncbi:MAG: ThuA domain-containing protein [Fimbriimonadaceae bacterium]|nr:ThuA domain-containing protein [Fimbriimonadaceae bacterium]